MTKFLKPLALSLVFVFVAVTAVKAQTASAPNLEIITPTEDETIYGDKMPVLFNVENFQIVDFAQNPKAAAGQGHIHLWLDDKTLSAESATKVIENTFTYSDVPYGRHTLVAQLVSNNHLPLTPEEKVTVNFTSAPASSPEEVAAEGFDKKTALVILVVVALVIIAAWWYTKDEDEEEMQEDKPKTTRKTKARKSTRKRRKA